MAAIIEFLIQGTLQKMELFAHQNNIVLWACDETFSHLYYVSSNYSSIWQRDVTEIYTSLKRWNSYLIEENKDEVIKKLDGRNTPINPNHTEYYCIDLPNGKKQWCIDRCFHLKNLSNECVLVAGIALPISENQLSGNNKQIVSDIMDGFIMQYYHWLTQSVDDNSKKNYTATYLEALSRLTSREKETLTWLLTGLTSKQIAQRLKISTRTVETHIHQLKSKFKAGCKSELISMAIENHCINVILPF